MNEPAPDKVARLRQALEDYHSGEYAQSGGGLFDREAEEAKSKVRSRALKILNQRARSRQELSDRLIAAEFEPAVVEEVVDDLERVDLLDDEKFAREWVRQRHQRRGKSRAILDKELVDKGVAASIRQEALETISPDDEQAMARAVALKKVKTIRKAPADRKEYDKLLRRVVGAMARRGFPEGMGFAIAKEALEQRLEEIR